VPYPPDDPDFDCASDPRDLPLQAEIWRYSPETETWERVYQSPNDVEIPEHPGRYTARDIGYRDMIVFEEPDGTEALYVCGATINALWPPMPPPRILRSTDGVTFEPIPQDPGTILGDLGQDQASFRDMEILNGRLYVINGKIQGHGAVLEAENPAGGNDSFRWVTPQDMRVFEMAPFSGFLYVGLADRFNGYAVMKTDAIGTPPYDFTPVVTDGGFLQPGPSPSVVSMHVFKDRLYAGTDEPVELIRINPDDTWDLVVGEPRETPDGWKYPLSGMGAGFDWPANKHLWRMQEHEGVLYLGTNDNSLRLGKAMPWLDRWLRSQYGFDLYRTSDGHYISPITVRGFGDKFQVGVRTFASTPSGLFTGSVSYWYGLRIWQAGASDEVQHAYLPLVGRLSDLVHHTYLPLVGRSSDEVYHTYLPLVGRSSEDAAAATVLGIGSSVVPGLSSDARFLAPPERLEAETKDGTLVLSWEPPPRATRFRVFRSDSTSNRELQIPDLDPDRWVPGPFAETGMTDQYYFVDANVSDGRLSQYYVLAEDAEGRISPPSNLVRAPFLAPVVTFERLGSLLGSSSTTGEIGLVLQEARHDAYADDLSYALYRLEQLRQTVKRGQYAALEPWQAEDLEIQLAKLARRVRLAQAGVISPSDLN
jgi:hypothetical protein